MATEPPAECKTPNPIEPAGQFGLFSCFISLTLVILAGYGAVCAVRSVLDGTRSKLAPEAIHAVLTTQETAWNAGDLDGFMDGYWKSDELKFLSGEDITTGWQATHDRYRKRYKSDGKEMGKLKFDILDVDILSSDAAIVRGRWVLTKSDGGTPHGLFTLLFCRIDGEWKIVSDHTSAVEK